MAEFHFIQSITHVVDDHEQPLDLAFQMQSVYVESIDLASPKFILKLNDVEGIFREDIGLNEGSVLRVTFADPYVMDEAHFTESFDVLTMKVDENDVLTINCLSSVINALKQPASKARFFVDMAASDILAELMPGVTITASDPAISEPYHLLPGMRPSKMIRHMAQEQGRVAYYRRGEFVYKSLEELLSEPGVYEYHHNDNRQSFQIAAFKHMSSRGVLQDKMNRHYTGWDMVEGIIESTDTEGYPVESTGLSSPLTLNNMAHIPVTVLDAFAGGNGGLSAGIAIDAVWNRGSVESPLMEALPDKFVVGTVAHQYSSQKYHCRMKGVLPENLI